MSGDNTIAGQTCFLSRAEADLLYEAVKYAYLKAKEGHEAGVPMPRSVKEAMHSIVAIVDRFDRIGERP